MIIIFIYFGFFYITKYTQNVLLIHAFFYKRFGYIAIPKLSLIIQVSFFNRDWLYSSIHFTPEHSEPIVHVYFVHRIITQIVHRVNYYKWTAVDFEIVGKKLAKFQKKLKEIYFYVDFITNYYLISFVANYQSVYNIFTKFVGK